MNYKNMSKAQLIERIEELEKQTIQYKLDSFVIESQLLLEDLLKATKFMYELGCKTRKAIGPIDVQRVSLLQPQVARVEGDKSTLSFDW